MSRRIDGIEVDEFEARATLAESDAVAFTCYGCEQRCEGAPSYDADVRPYCEECAEYYELTESAADADAPERDDVERWLSAGAADYDETIAKVEAMARAERVRGAA